MVEAGRQLRHGRRRAVVLEQVQAVKAELRHAIIAVEGLARIVEDPQDAVRGVVEEELERGQPGGLEVLSLVDDDCVEPLVGQRVDGRVQCAG